MHEKFGCASLCLDRNSVYNQPKPESPFRLFSLSTDSQLPVSILSSFFPLLHFSCTSQNPAQRENLIRVEWLPEWNILTFQNKLSLRCFKKACIKCRESCYKRFNSFHIDLNKQHLMFAHLMVAMSQCKQPGIFPTHLCYLGHVHVMTGRHSRIAVYEGVGAVPA